MSRHQFDLLVCHKLPGTHVGKLCEKCDGKCPACDSYVHSYEQVRVCDECAFGENETKCIICYNPGVSEAYYCYECVMREKNREGCPRVISIGSSRSNLFYEKRKQA
ncbi:U2 snRNP complex subunit RDS3 [Ascoidea rubescens DSM 1968]|uniref:PHF5-like protein n=1 Tax=Ascoidea rubescens DSM 1968 TaxID=1344418 RepID=A0A1D2VNY9_9ASCO|nr:PHF5-like protein [Ascoidea rubescens DSM 1968]ODV63265.1 PHF5-like protein [Ascoidea rubescens DSM 1968]